MRIIIFENLKRQLSNTKTNQYILLQSIKVQDLIPAAVMVLICKETKELLYIKRSNVSRNHQGEIAFPGGKYDQSDENLLETAKRELFEEVKIPPNFVELLGTLKPMQTVSGFHILPFVGSFSKYIPFFSNSQEVEKAFLVPLDHLYQQKNKNIRFYGKKKIHYFVYERFVIWGATAAITKELLSQIEEKNIRKQFST